MTQYQKIIQYMGMNDGITTLEAATHLHITRLAARIAEMKDRGVKIIDCTETSKNSDGKRTTYKRYRLG